jgi:HAUS augmin-like complex subunit 1
MGLKSKADRTNRSNQRTRKTNTLNNTLLTSLQTSLSTNGTTDLTTQATTAILLNTTPEATNLATSLLTLSTSLSVLNNQLAATCTLQSSLLSHQTTLHSELQDLQPPAFKSEKNLPQRTAEISRQTKLLKAKVAEYDERLRNTSSAEVPEKLLMDVEAAKENAEVLMQRVRDVEEKIEVYEGVPPEAREVRRVMVELRGELEGWVRRRDGLFEGLVGGGR